MFSGIWNILKELGLTGGNLVLIILLVYGYLKLAKNHFKHLNDRLLALEKGQKCLDDKFKGLKRIVIKLDKKVGILEALRKKN
jgi:hypothetical protein